MDPPTPLKRFSINKNNTYTKKNFLHRLSHLACNCVIDT